MSVTFLFGSPVLAQDATAPVTAPEIITSFDPDGEPCTGVPDAVPGVFDFAAACTQHDACYAAAGDRLACDLGVPPGDDRRVPGAVPSASIPRRYTCLTFAELNFGASGYSAASPSRLRS